MHYNTIDLTGKKFGKLTVLAISDERGKRNQVKWICKCDCGKKHVVTGESLRNGKSKSCGCLKKNAYNKIKDRELALWKFLYSSTIKKRNKEKGFTQTDITIERFIEISKQKCFYCGQEPQNIVKDISRSRKKILVSSTTIKFNGLDRINSKEGYFNNNVITCCEKCNRAKNTMTQKEFKEWIVKVYNNYCQNGNRKSK